MKEYNEKGYFINSEGINSKDLEPKKRRVGGKGKPVDDTVKPKKATTAWLFFHKENYEPTRKELNDTKSCTEVMKKNAEKWGASTPQQKKKYVAMAEKDQARHDKQVEEMKSKGYFTMEDGTKSTDSEPKSKRSRK